jgi:hypothetical protein
MAITEKNPTVYLQPLYLLRRLASGHPYIRAPRSQHMLSAAIQSLLTNKTLSSVTFELERDGEANDDFTKRFSGVQRHYGGGANVWKYPRARERSRSGRGSEENQLVCMATQARSTPAVGL